MCDPMAPAVSATGEESTHLPDTMAAMRRRYLACWSAPQGFLGKAAKIHMRQITGTIDATLLATDGKQQELLVAGLETPLGDIPHARLRASDVVHFSVPLGLPMAANACHQQLTRMLLRKTSASVLAVNLA